MPGFDAFFFDVRVRGKVVIAQVCRTKLDASRSGRDFRKIASSFCPTLARENVKRTAALIGISVVLGSAS
jgi:hypothetical protein